MECVVGEGGIFWPPKKERRHRRRRLFCPPPSPGPFTLSDGEEEGPFAICSFGKKRGARRKTEGGIGQGEQDQGRRAVAASIQPNAALEYTVVVARRAFRRESRKWSRREIGLSAVPPSLPSSPTTIQYILSGGGGEKSGTKGSEKEEDVFEEEDGYGVVEGGSVTAAEGGPRLD